MWFTLIIPDSESSVDTGDEVNAGFSRHGVIELLDRLGATHDWPYEVLDNLSQGERDRFYRDEAEPAARVEGVSISVVFGFDGQAASRLGAAVPALVAHATDGRPIAVYPHRSQDGTEAFPIVPYLEELLADRTA
jgi:hypothetical protein